MARDRPLIRLEPTEHPFIPRRDFSPSSDDEEDDPPKRWYHYVPVVVLVFMLLAPQPSWLILIVKYHLYTLHLRVVFVIHLLVSYTLTFLAFSSLIVCVARDPGPIPTPSEGGGIDEDDEETSITEALMSTPNDPQNPRHWCKKCCAPKPERAHHCSYCRRCILKMDHHCPWIAYKCIGHRTYSSFVHFLICVNLLALYIGVVSLFAIFYAFNNPEKIDATTPIHELALSFGGIIITIVVGSFTGFHMYLITTGQTTLESLTPFLLLRELPDVPGTNVRGPPQEHQLSYAQRRIVKRASGYIRLYDLGWKKNWAGVFGWERKHGWVYRLLVGGGGRGDGMFFQRNPRADELLARLAQELADSDKSL